METMVFVTVVINFKTIFKIHLFLDSEDESEVKTVKIGTRHICNP